MSMDFSANEPSSDRSEQIARLRREHSELEGRLERMTSLRHLSSSEQVEMRRIKRLKLHKKDRIHYLTRLGKS